MLLGVRQCRSSRNKNTYKHYYEDEHIAIITDLSKGNDFWQVFYKPTAVKKIIEWFNENKDAIEYKIINVYLSTKVLTAYINAIIVSIIAS